MGCGSQKAQTSVLNTENIKSNSGAVDTQGETLDLQQFKSTLDKQINEYNLLNFDLPYQQYKDVVYGINYGQMFKILIEMQDEILKQLPRPYQTDDQRQQLIALITALIDIDLPKYFLNKYLFYELNYKLYTVEQFSPEEIAILQKTQIVQEAKLKKNEPRIVNKSTLIESLNKFSSTSPQGINIQYIPRIIQLIENGIEEPQVDQYVTTNYKILNILTSEGENDTQSHSQDYYVQYYQRYNSQLGITLSTRRQQLQQSKTLVQKTQ